MIWEPTPQLATELEKLHPICSDRKTGLSALQSPLAWRKWHHPTFFTTTFLPHIDAAIVELAG